MNYSALISRPFIDGGQGPDEFDCWGLVRYLYKNKFNLDLPLFPISAFATDEVANAININKSDMGFEQVDHDQLQEGDIVTLSLSGDHLVNHVGYVMNSNQFIHALDKQGVVISPLSGVFFRSRIREFFRCLNLH